MKIRVYREADEEPVLSLWDRSGIGRPWLDLRAEILEKRKRDRSLFLVATEAGAVVGAVMGAYDGRRGWVYHIAADPGCRQSGIGRALMTDLERRMRRMGVGKINLQVRSDNLAVIGFYERLGYKDENLVSMGKWLTHPGVNAPKDRSHT